MKQTKKLLAALNSDSLVQLYKHIENHENKEEQLSWIQVIVNIIDIKILLTILDRHQNKDQIIQYLSTKQTVLLFKEYEEIQESEKLIPLLN